MHCALCLSRRWAGLLPSERCSNAKTPHNSAGFCYGVPDDDLLSQARSPLSSALRRFTFLFEMEKGWDHLAIFVKLNWFWSVCSRSEEHTSELQSRGHLVCRLLLEKKNK